MKCLFTFFGCFSVKEMNFISLGVTFKNIYSDSVLLTNSLLLGTLSKGLTLSMKLFLVTISTSLCLFLEVSLSCIQKVLRSQLAVKINKIYAICNYHMFIPNSFIHFLPYIHFISSTSLNVYVTVYKLHLTYSKLRWFNVTKE